MTRIAVCYDGSLAASVPDVVIGQVVDSLKRSGHDAEPLALPQELNEIESTLRQFAPEMVFNLAESCAGKNEFDVHLAALLEMLGIPFTGSGVQGLMLAQDKVLSKKLFAFEGLPFPRFAGFYDEALEGAGDLRFPLIVKPIRLDASIGIDATSVVRKSLDLLEKVRQVRAQFGGAALVEEYIEGREISVAVLGNEEPQPLPPIEVDFSKFPKRRPRIMDARAKFDESSAEYRGTTAVVSQLDEALREELERAAVRAFRALRLRDYGRIDFRLDKQHRLFILEANPNPYLESSAELAMAAKAAGIEHDALVERILESALDRARRRPVGVTKAAGAAAPAANGNGNGNGSGNAADDAPKG